VESATCVSSADLDDEGLDDLVSGGLTRAAAVDLAALSALPSTSATSVFSVSRPIQRPTVREVWAQPANWQLSAAISSRGPGAYHFFMAVTSAATGEGSQTDSGQKRPAVVAKKASEPLVGWRRNFPM
jgi:hypothetical protein